MESIGQYLQQQRASQGVTLEQIAVKTRINVGYLIALEKDQFERFPSETFARGFVRAYARCLALDENDVLRRFSASSEAFYSQREQAQLAIRQQTEDSIARYQRRTLLGRVSVTVAVFGAFSLVYAVNSWQRTEPPAIQAPAAEPLAIETGPAALPTEAAPPAAPAPSTPARATAPPAVNLPAAKVAAKLSPSTAPPPAAGAPAPGTAAPPTAPAPPPVNLPTVLARLDTPPAGAPGAPTAPGDPLTLTIEATDAGWVAARIDGNEMKEVYLEPGEKVTWRASDGFVLSLGNAGGVRVELNGKTLGPLGSKGAVVKNILID